MADTNFVDQTTIIQAPWCNDVNDHVYNNTPVSPATTVHSASLIANTPAGGIAATTVQAALNELDTEKLRVDTAASTYSSLTTLAASSGSSLIGHIGLGAGAVATTVQTKLREYVSVFDFMTSAQIADAIANTGAIDSTAAVQSALTNNSATEISVGNFLCSGATAGNTVKKVYGDGTLSANAANETILQLTADTTRAHTKVLSGLTFSGNSKTGVTGLMLGSVTNNPSGGAQEAALYTSVRDVTALNMAVGFNSQVSMEHSWDNTVANACTIGYKFYSDSVNGGQNANSYTALRAQSNTVGVIVKNNSATLPLHNDAFRGMTLQGNSVCGFYSSGLAGGLVVGLHVSNFHVESNGGGAATTSVDGAVIKQSDFHLVKTTAVLSNSDLASSHDPFLIAESGSVVLVDSLTGYGSPVGTLFSCDATSSVYESGLAIGTGIKNIQSYGFLSSIGNMASIGAPCCQIGQYKNHSTMPNPAIPLLDNTTGVTATGFAKDSDFGIVSTCQFAASVGNSGTNRNYWYAGVGVSGEYCLQSVLVKSSVNALITFSTLFDGAYKTFTVSFLAGIWQRIVIIGNLVSTTGLQTYIFPADSVGATLAFKAHQYLHTTSLSEINNAYHNGLCGVHSLNYEQLTAAPTTGTWKQNEIVWNSSSAASTTPGWVCTVAGTPGTWKAMAALEA